MAYKGYVDYMMAGVVSQYCFMLSKQGAFCGSSLAIQAMPKYEFDFEDENGKKSKIVVDQLANILDGLKNGGVVKASPAGIRLYNQKFYSSSFDVDEKGHVKWYLKKSKGGACICTTNNYILIGAYNSEIKMGNGQPQCPGELNKRIEALAANLLSSNN